MSESDPKNTQSPTSIPTGKKKKFPGWLVALIFILLIVVGALGGYGSGISRRYSAQDTQVSEQLLDQFRLGLEAMDAEQYEVAKQHLEYIIQKDPDFPGVQSTYADLLLRMQITPTLTPTLTPTITPTPDLRAAEEIYDQVVGMFDASADSLCDRDWDGIISTLDSLRKASASFHTAEVDGMYYMALRSRGMCKIYPQAYKPDTYCSDLNINLEGGIYDLTMAEKFGDLDAQAVSLRTYARLYIVGSSFWDQDWLQAQDYFAQVMAAYPYLADSSCETATERWRYSTIKAGEEILAKGKLCQAQPYYIAAFSIGSSRNEEYYPTATEIASQCGEGKTPTPR